MLQAWITQSQRVGWPIISEFWGWFMAGYEQESPQRWLRQVTAVMTQRISEWECPMTSWYQGWSNTGLEQWLPFTGWEQVWPITVRGRGFEGHPRLQGTRVTTQVGAVMAQRWLATWILYCMSRYGAESIGVRDHSSQAGRRCSPSRMRITHHGLRAAKIRHKQQQGKDGPSQFEGEPSNVGAGMDHQNQGCPITCQMAHYNCEQGWSITDEELD